MPEEQQTDTLAEQVIKIIAQQLGHTTEPETKDHLYEELGADSLDVVELRIELEQELNIDINDEEFETWENVGDVIATVRKLSA